MTLITLSQPPPSMNNLYPASGRKRRRSDRYNKWLTLAGTELMIQHPKKHKGRVRLKMVFGFATNHVRDVFNYEKPTIDLLTRHQVIQDDNTKFLRGGEVWLAEDVGEDFVGVRIEIQEVA